MVHQGVGHVRLQTHTQFVNVWSRDSSTHISSDSSLNIRISNFNVNDDTCEDISDSILNEPNADSSRKPRNERKQKKHSKRCHRNKTQQWILLDHFVANGYFNTKKNDIAVKLIQSLKNGEGMCIKLYLFNACHLSEFCYSHLQV